MLACVLAHLQVLQNLIIRTSWIELFAIGWNAYRVALGELVVAPMLNIASGDRKGERCGIRSHAFAIIWVAIIDLKFFVLWKGLGRDLVSWN